jgi:hypothetical protein
LLEQWKKSTTVQIYKKGYKSNCSNYWGILLLWTSYKILSNILLSRLYPYVEEIIWDHQCGFWYNRSTADHIFCIHHIVETNWSKMGQYISYSYTSTKPVIELGGKYCTIFSYSFGYPWNYLGWLKCV